MAHWQLSAEFMSFPVHARPTLSKVKKVKVYHIRPLTAYKSLADVSACPPLFPL